MAKMCPMAGCKEKSGICIHEKIIFGLVVIIILVVINRVIGLL
jgi:hypothetical protein